jgi:hypothetical protein
MNSDFEDKQMILNIVDEITDVFRKQGPFRPDIFCNVMLTVLHYFVYDVATLEGEDFFDADFIKITKEYLKNFGKPAFKRKDIYQ